MGWTTFTPLRIKLRMPADWAIYFPQSGRFRIVAEYADVSRLVAAGRWAGETSLWTDVGSLELASVNEISRYLLRVIPPHEASIFAEAATC